jgi:hypothetical protein
MPQIDGFRRPRRTVLSYDALGRVLTKRARAELASRESTTCGYDLARFPPAGDSRY